MTRLISVTALACLFCLCAASVAHAAATRRVALLVGANDGGADRVRLRYAIDDARALGKVLGELGGIAPADLRALPEPTRDDLVAALKGEARRLAAMQGRIEFVFYYSGHSDEQGLLLQGERLKYADLRALINQLPATVRIAIVDACASGALTRAKGGVRRAPFLLDESNAVAGSAILTSASADEAAQESDRIRGSFFTHALLSGLRGAADRSGDGRVTLTEAYQFAYAETLSHTETTRIGAQHPNYDLRLSGRGEVVLTDVRGTAAGMLFASDIDGRLAVRDGDGVLIAELTKRRGRAMELGLPAGKYRIFWHAAGKSAQADVDVPTGSRAQLATADFTPIDAPLHRARGGAAKHANSWDINALRDDGAVNGFELGMAIHRKGAVKGMQLSGLYAITEGPIDGAQLASLYVSAGGVDGVQIGGLASRTAGTIDGLQLGGVAAIAGRLDGVQVAGIYAHAADGMDGLQIGGIATTAIGESAGGQIAGIASLATTHTGAQISGVVNMAQTIDGVQIGLINVGEQVNGAQIGLINIARRMRGAPIGLINIIGDGVHSLEAWGSDLQPFNAGVRLGSQAFQTVIAIGADEGFSNTRAGFGVGGRVGLPSHFDVTIDAMAWLPEFEAQGDEWRVDDWYDIEPRARLLVGWTWGVVRVFGGPVLRVDIEPAPPTIQIVGSTGSRGDTAQFGAGFALGVSVF